jgi:hypothetical protein
MTGKPELIGVHSVGFVPTNALVAVTGGRLDNEAYHER